MPSNLRFKLKLPLFIIALCLLFFALGFMPLMSSFSYEAALAAALLGLVFIPIIHRWVCPKLASPPSMAKLCLHCHCSALIFFTIAIGMALLNALRTGDLCDLTEGFKYFLH